MLVNVRVRERKDLAHIVPFQQALRSHEASLNESGRILVRYSGTEPLVRIMVEAGDSEMVQKIAHHLADVLRAEVGEG
jgi:phosphoglucosamine mutase